MKSFDELVQIVKTLRGPQGCPWDREQTHQSLTPYAVEEAHELEEAIHNKDVENLKEELGDLLFQSILHSEIARQEGNFDINDVIVGLNQKMVHRHPHVFSQTQVKDSKEVLENWEKLKEEEKPKGFFEIPKSFPALLRAYKIGSRAQKKGLDDSSSDEAWRAVEQSYGELEKMINQRGSAQEALGDLLFCLAQLARHLDVNPEKALRQTNAKFIDHFSKRL